MKKYFEVEKCTHHTTEIPVNASENVWKLFLWAIK